MQPASNMVSAPASIDGTPSGWAIETPNFLLPPEPLIPPTPPSAPPPISSAEWRARVRVYDRTLNIKGWLIRRNKLRRQLISDPTNTLVQQEHANAAKKTNEFIASLVTFLDHYSYVLNDEYIDGLWDDLATYTFKTVHTSEYNRMDAM
jgi:hypothetical protein